MVVIDILAIGVALGYGPGVIEQLAGIRTILQEKFI
jgi:hypothetical protein